MQAEHWDRVQELLDRALALPEDRRAAFLGEQHGVEPQVIAEVESLLTHHSQDFLDRGVIADLVEPVENVPDDRIEGYELGRVLGQGGMGVVFQAEQTEGVRRTVAIKLIKLGMDTRQVVSRFDTERQVLASMSHSGIARVYDAGATVDGRPYFVMEYVEGRRITDYCDESRASMHERLELFVRVCDAIQHAHQKGIIHRDIKPSNILITEEDGRPTPKIIDFGIAKATEQRPTEATALTEAGQVIGTMAYMSPEQADLSGRDIDTRTDVYSLGVLLYELLVGALPFDASGPRPAFAEAYRKIREVDPPRPSTRFNSLGDTSSVLSERRRTDAKSFVRALRGDLDWIVMKALEKERARRYASVSELSADIGRFLSHEPVEARPPGTLYRVGKFVRRHRLGVASGAVVALALLAGIVGTSIGMLRAVRAEGEARAAQQLATQEAARANDEAASFERIADYLVGVFEVADPGDQRANTVTAREILDSKAAEIRGALEEEPGVRGRLMAAMGEAYMGLGLYDEALALLEEGLPLLREAQDDAQIYDALNELGILANWMEDYERARGHLEESLAVFEKIHGPEHPHLPPILKNLGDVCVKLGELQAARGYLDRALALRTARYGSESKPVAKTLSSYAGLLVEAGDHAGAIAMAGRSLEIRRALYAPGDSGLAHGHLALGDALFAAGEFARAREHFGSALEIWSASLGETHGFVGAVSFRLARTLVELNEPDLAYDAYRRARAIEEGAFREDDPRMARALADSLEEYAAFLGSLGRSAEAGEAVEEANRLRSRHGLRS